MPIETVSILLGHTSIKTTEKCCGAVGEKSADRLRRRQPRYEKGVRERECKIATKTK
jgi:hypothetical protein